MDAFEPDHIHFIATATLYKPSFTKVQIGAWLCHLVRSVEMNILAGPFVCDCDDVGNEGITGVVVLTESHSSIHIWDKKDEPYLKMDLYSCKGFSSHTVLDCLRELDPLVVNYVMLDRNHQPICGDLSALKGPILIEEGTIDYRYPTPLLRISDTELV